MSVAQRRVQTDVSQLPPPDVLLLGSDVGEDDAVGLKAHLLGGNQDVGLADLNNTIIVITAITRKKLLTLYLGELEEPEHCVGHSVENVDPHLECGRIDLVELVEVAVDNGVLGKAVLLTGGHHDLRGKKQGK